jgi:hypothetical protein
MFGCPKWAKAWELETAIPLKLMTIGKNCKGVYDEKEDLDAAADRLASFGDVYRA